MEGRFPPTDSGQGLAVGRPGSAGPSRTTSLRRMTELGRPTNGMFHILTADGQPQGDLRSDRASTGLPAASVAQLRGLAEIIGLGCRTTCEPAMSPCLDNACAPGHSLCRYAADAGGIAAASAGGHKDGARPEASALYGDARSTRHSGPGSSPAYSADTELRDS